MKKVNMSTKYIGRFAGKWVAIDTKREKIIGVSADLKDLSPLISGKRGGEDKIKAAAFLVPRKDEGPYILTLHV